MRARGLLALALVAACFAVAARAAEPLPIFDAHLHYNVEATGPYPVDAVFALWKKSGVIGVIATSRPNDGSRALYAEKQSAVKVFPFIRPYVVQPDRYTWFSDPKIYALIESEFRRGIYRGIGEFHLFGKDAESPWVKKTVDFAVANDLWLHAHSDDAAIDILFAHNPQARIIWAHTGFTSTPETIERYFERYPALIGELSYRYDVVAEGKLRADWRRLLLKYPDRFVLGSDTWVNGRWSSYADIMAGYRAWLAQLPTDVAMKIAYGNGERLFGKLPR
jgi:predicted TIM-barrel fold metal-dependent hydrolase